MCLLFHKDNWKGRWLVGFSAESMRLGSCVSCRPPEWTVCVCVTVSNWSSTARLQRASLLPAPKITRLWRPHKRSGSANRWHASRATRCVTRSPRLRVQKPHSKPASDHKVGPSFATRRPKLLPVGRAVTPTFIMSRRRVRPARERARHSLRSELLTRAEQPGRSPRRAWPPHSPRGAPERSIN